MPPSDEMFLCLWTVGPLQHVLNSPSQTEAIKSRSMVKVIVSDSLSSWLTSNCVFKLSLFFHGDQFIENVIFYDQQLCVPSSSVRRYFTTDTSSEASHTISFILHQHEAGPLGASGLYCGGPRGWGRGVYTLWPTSDTANLAALQRACLEWSKCVLLTLIGHVQ